MFVQVNIKNCPSEEDLTEEYIVARLIDNKFWYYGNYSEVRAVEVAEELGDNAAVFKVQGIIKEGLDLD